METIAEKELVVLAQQGDEEAFETLINLSLIKLRALLASQYRLQPTDLDEVIQVATIKVFKKFETFRNESAFTTWFYIVLRNEAIDFIKKRNTLHSHEVSAHHDYLGENEDIDYEHLTIEQTFSETAASLMDKRELLASYRSMIWQVLNELSPQHSQIIRMSLDEGKTYKSIAKELNIPIGTVMSRLFFARKKAQQLIIQYANRYAVQLDCLGRR